LTITDAEEEEADVGDLHRDARESGVVRHRREVCVRDLQARGHEKRNLGLVIFEDLLEDDAHVPQKEDPDHDELCVSGEATSKPNASPIRDAE